MTTPKLVKLHISKGTEANSFAIRAECHNAQANGRAVLPQGDFDTFLSWVRELVATPDEIETLGRELYNFLFPEPIRELYIQNRPREDEPPLYIRITVAADALQLHQIPWEYAFDGRQFLAHQFATPIVRHLDAPFNRALKPLPHPLKVLLVTAEPEEMGETHPAEEIRIVSEALAALGDRVLLETLPNATRDTLYAAVQTFQPHIFHYMGHGGWNDNEGGLFLEKVDSPEADFVSGRELAVILDTVSFMILNGCETAALADDAQNEQGKSLLGVTPRLIQRVGVPAILGMQFVIPGPQAKSFMTTFYEGVTAGQPLTAALTEARRKLFFINEGKNYWAIPALFLRSDNDLLFDVTAQADVEEAPPDEPLPVNSLPNKAYKLLIGRADEQAQILQKFEADDKQMVVVVGLGGMGKTALAREVAEIAQERELFDHIVWTSAKTEFFRHERTETEQQDLYSFESVLTDICRQCGRLDLLQTPLEQRKEAVAYLLSQKHVLLVMDNLETVADYDGLVADIYALLGKSKLFITSRHRIVHDHAYTVELSGFPLSDGIRFLKEEGRQRNLQAVANAPEETLAQIHTAAGGAPLALKLVVGQLVRQPMREVLKALKEVTTTGQDYEFYRFVYWHSWNLLSEEGQFTLVDMSVFPPITGGAAEDVAAISDLASDPFWVAMEQLVLMSLVDKTGGLGQERYALHPLTHYFVLADITEEWAVDGEDA